MFKNNTLLNFQVRRKQKIGKKKKKTFSVAEFCLYLANHA